MQEGLKLVVEVGLESVPRKDWKLQILEILACPARDSLFVMHMLIARTIELLFGPNKEVVVFAANHSDELVLHVHVVSCADPVFKPRQMCDDIDDVISGLPSSSSGLVGDHILQLQKDEVLCAPCLEEIFSHFFVRHILHAPEVRPKIVQALIPWLDTSIA